MKALDLFAKVEVKRSGISSITRSDFENLDGKLFIEAVQEGLIEDVDPEKVLVPHAEYDVVYAVFDGKAVQISEKAHSTILATLKSGENPLEVLGGLKFRSGISNVEGEGEGKFWMRLAMSGELNLDNENAVSFQAQPLKKKAGTK